MIVEMKTLNGRQYQVCNGTWYHPQTPFAVIDHLETIRRQGMRVRFSWGDSSSGKDWGEVHDVTGYLSRSTGPVKAPILLATRRNSGGPVILDHCVVRICYANKAQGKDIYCHPGYHTD